VPMKGIIEQEKGSCKREKAILFKSGVKIIQEQGQKLEKEERSA